MNKSAVLLATFLVVRAMSFGQGLTSVTGIVSDPTGAVIPNASLTLENLDTSAKREISSDETGRYTFAQVQPGRYSLTGRAAGFNDVILNDIRLLVNTPATVNVSFEKVGTVAEVVSVSAEALQINTQDASLGNAIGTRPIVELPLFARNPAALLTFQPGVTNFGTGSDSYVGADPLVGGTSTIDDRNGAVNGGRSDQSNITLDGVDVNNQQTRRAFETVLRVTPDSVQEFRTTTLNATADQGRTSGAQIALITRSGTNELRGALYHLHRNTATAANRFFNNSSGIPRPALLINIFGGRMGGHIVRNRLFWFGNYEGRRDASANTVTRNVPSLQLRQGFVQYLRTDGSTAILTPQDLRTTVDPLGIGANQQALQLMQSYPAPNDSTVGDGLNIVGYRFTAGQHTKKDTYIAKFDWVVDQNSKHQAFLRGQLQNDRARGLPQFPGEPANSVGLDNSKGIAAGLTSAFSPTVVNTFRYGFTRQGAETAGILSSPTVTFRNIDARYGTTAGRTRIIPVHHISDDLSWQRGAHDIRVGGTMRWIANQSRSSLRTFHSASANLSWLNGTGSDLRTNLPDLSVQFRTAYGDAAMAALGIISQVNAYYNYNIDGSVLPTGAPIVRDFRNHEYEWYVQDTWKLTRSLTLTVGLRHSLMPPVYEANGVQTSSSIPLEDWFYQRAALMNAGLPTRDAGLISFNLRDSPAGRDFYEFHKKNFAPRVSIAWSPQGSDGLSRFFFGGPNKTSIRAGWGMFYDLFGQGIIRAVDSTAFGLATALTNPSSSLTASTAPRFTGFTSLPTQILPAAPPVQFPVQQPTSGAGSFAITNSIDDKIRPPYNLSMNLSIQRELPGGFMVQAAYVGRLSRRSMVARDIAMPANLRDPASGMTYFEAAKQMVQYTRADNFNVNSVPRMAYFENLWPQLATASLSATQRVAQVFNDNALDETGVLFTLDRTPSLCSRLGCNAFFSPQFSALAATSSIANANYHAMQWTVRKRYSAGLEFDFNYTLSKSIDIASQSEWASWAGALTTGYNGFLVNSWEQRQQRGVSDYDALHIFNGWAVWQLPFGRGQRWATDAGGWKNAVIGGWQLTPTISMSSGLPASIGNGRVWPTNWNITGLATIAGPLNTSVGSTRNAPAISGPGGPNIFGDPSEGIKAFDFTVPGESGNRNILRGDGPFVLSLGVSKRFLMPYSESHSVQFRWETFNLTNTARFNVSSLQGNLTSLGTLGKYTETLGDPRQMQFMLRYEF